MARNNLWLVGEVWSLKDKNNIGPTGQFCEVPEVAVCDHGGNEYGRATTARGIDRIQNRLRIQTTLEPRKIGKLLDEKYICPETAVYCGIVDEARVRT